jgi:ribosome-binding factor A
MPRGSHRHSSGHSGSRAYPRTARINESMREVIADELEHIDDDRLELVTVTGIEIDPDLGRARVYYSALSGQQHASEAFQAHRARLQAAVGRQIRMKRTPLLSFMPDPAIDEGLKIEALIHTMPRSPEGIDYGIDDIDGDTDEDLDEGEPEGEDEP